MTTVINNPGESSDSGAGLLIGIVVILILLAIFFVYGLPALRHSGAPAAPGSATVNVQLPSGGGTGGTAQ